MSTNDDFKGFDSASSGSLNPLHLISAAVVSCVPVYLHAVILDLPLQSNLVTYVVITLLCTVLLAVSYRNVQKLQNARLASIRKSVKHNHKALGLTALEARNAQVANTATEAMWYSFLQNNLIFLGLYLFFTFYMLQSFPMLYNYTLSASISVVCTWQFSDFA
jgi:hypothetical protein